MAFSNASRYTVLACMLQLCSAGCGFFSPSMKLVTQTFQGTGTLSAEGQDSNQTVDLSVSFDARTLNLRLHMIQNHKTETGFILNMNDGTTTNMNKDIDAYVCTIAPIPSVVKKFLPTFLRGAVAKFTHAAKCMNRQDDDIAYEIAPQDFPFARFLPADEKYQVDTDVTNAMLLKSLKMQHHGSDTGAWQANVQMSKSTAVGPSDADLVPPSAWNCKTVPSSLDLLEDMLRLSDLNPDVVV